MSSPEALRAAARLLRDAGYEDASATSRPTSDPEHVLSVTIGGVGCGMQVEWIVNGVDPAAEPLALTGTAPHQIMPVLLSRTPPRDPVGVDRPGAAPAGPCG